LTFLHHLKPEKILLFITSLCYYINHKSVVEPALTAILHHRIKRKKYSRDHEPWSFIMNSISMKNRVLYSAVNVIQVINEEGELGRACDSCGETRNAYRMVRKHEG
jgi:hypothetical protein